VALALDLPAGAANQSLVLSGLILRRIFDKNQLEFTNADAKTIPTVAVVEEAQSVLNENAAASEPYISWVKEGRKYDLGAVLITQQPSSIPVEILSQGDNWFVFHLLSAADLTTLKRANAHFSDDLLSSLLNEPIAGQGVFWSSVGGKPYPVSLRVLSFERMYRMRDPHYNQAAAATYAQSLKGIFTQVRQSAQTALIPEMDAEQREPEETAAKVDVSEGIKASAIRQLGEDRPMMEKLTSPEGAAWGAVRAYFLQRLPTELDDRETLPITSSRRRWTSCSVSKVEGGRPTAILKRVPPTSASGLDR
jgi:hypothetical protein